MHKVQRMTQTPTQCLYCGRGNTPDDPDTEDEFWAVDLERDINWGDPTYLCKYCCEQIAMLAGFVTMDQLQDEQNLNQALKLKVHNLRAKLEQRERRLNQITTGAKAMRAEKKRKATTKKEAA